VENNPALEAATALISCKDEGNGVAVMTKRIMPHKELLVAGVGVAEGPGQARHLVDAELVQDRVRRTGDLRKCLWGCSARRGESPGYAHDVCVLHDALTVPSAHRLMAQPGGRSVLSTEHDAGEAEPGVERRVPNPDLSESPKQERDVVRVQVGTVGILDQFLKININNNQFTRVGSVSS
jgi:hypothetical protein